MFKYSLLSKSGNFVLYKCKSSYTGKKIYVIEYTGRYHSVTRIDLCMHFDPGNNRRISGTYLPQWKFQTRKIAEELLIPAILKGW